MLLRVQDPLDSMKRAYGISLAIAIVTFLLSTRLLLYTEAAPDAWWMFGLCGVVGIICSCLLVVRTLNIITLSLVLSVVLRS